MLGGNYAAARQPQGLKHLVVSNSPASIALYVQGLNQLLDKFPVEMQHVLRGHEANGTTGTQEYREARMVFNKRHVCTMDPLPRELMESYAVGEGDKTVDDAL